MPLPNSYKNTIIPEKKIDDTNSFLSSIIQNIAKFDPTQVVLSEKSISFKSKRALFSIPYNVNIELDAENNVIYEFTLANLLKISILIFIFIPFFSNFSFNTYLIFAFFIVFAFYFLSIVFINSSIKSAINKIWDIPDLEIVDQQKEWISNPDKCPACGAYVSAQQTKCLDCGLTIVDSGNQKQYNFKTLNYHYVEKKKNVNS